MRDIPVGNGRLLVNFDDKYQIRDIYFPHVGQENHTEGFPFRFGVWADGQFSWVADDEWDRSIGYLPETLVTEVKLTNRQLGIEIVSSDSVASHEDIFLRRVRVCNLRDETRNLRVFLHHDFRIYENKFGDTAFYDPETSALIHYKKHRYFLINTEPRFDSFATGRKAFRDQEGTWRDAEDGELHGKAKSEGSVDSTISINFRLEKNSAYEFHYWIAAATSLEEAAAHNRHVLERGAGKHLDHTGNYWRAWVNKDDMDFGDLPLEIVALYKRSLLIINTQIDEGGAILAANDSDVTHRATDHYSYLWTRDGAFVAHALDLAGYYGITRAFYSLCAKIVHPDGYFLQKYNPDGTVASGWHSAWDIHSKKQIIPIQEDETALVLWAFWEHYKKYRDVEFSHRIYHKMIVRCAEFMVKFRHPEMKLPMPSWNLWEDRRGIHTFTSATVVAGLRAAANFAELFAETERCDKYRQTADEIVEAMRTHLYSKQERRFLRSLHSETEEHFTPDATVDASLFGIFYFGCFSADDEMVVNTMKAIEERLRPEPDLPGVSRFEGDGYMRQTEDNAPSNSWFVCTLWLAEYYIARAKTEEDLKPALDILNWIVKMARPSGVLSEQLNPLTGEQLSVSPLTWSHSAFVTTVISFLKKLSHFS